MVLGDKNKKEGQMKKKLYECSECGMIFPGTSATNMCRRCGAHLRTTRKVVRETPRGPVYQTMSLRRPNKGRHNGRRPVYR